MSSENTSSLAASSASTLPGMSDKHEIGLLSPVLEAAARHMEHRLEDQGISSILSARTPLDEWLGACGGCLWTPRSSAISDQTQATLLKRIDDANTSLASSGLRVSASGAKSACLRLGDCLLLCRGEMAAFARMAKLALAALSHPLLQPHFDSTAMARCALVFATAAAELSCAWLKQRPAPIGAPCACSGRSTLVRLTMASAGTFPFPDDHPHLPCQLARHGATARIASLPPLMASPSSTNSTLATTTTGMPSGASPGRGLAHQPRCFSPATAPASSAAASATPDCRSQQTLSATSVKQVRFMVRGCAKFLAAIAEPALRPASYSAPLPVSATDQEPGMLPAVVPDCVERCLERICRAHAVCGTVLVTALREVPSAVSEDDAGEMRADLAVAMVSACGLVRAEPLRVARACSGALCGFVPPMLPHPSTPTGAVSAPITSAWGEAAGARRLGAGGMVASVLSAAPTAWRSGQAAAGSPLRRGSALGPLALLQLVSAAVERLTAPCGPHALPSPGEASRAQLALAQAPSMAATVRAAAARRAAELVALSPDPAAALLPCIRFGVRAAATAQAARSSVYCSFAAALRATCPVLAAAADGQVAAVAEAAADSRVAWRLSLAAATAPRTAADDAAAASALHDSVGVRREVFALAVSPPGAECRIDAAIAAVARPGPAASASASLAAPCSRSAAVSAAAGVSGDLAKLGALRAAAGTSRSRLPTLPCDAWQPYSSDAAAVTAAHASALMGVWRAKPGRALPPATARAGARAAEEVLAAGAESAAGLWLARAVTAAAKECTR